PIPVTYPLAREPMSFCFVRVETDSGLVGWGEARDSYGCSYAGVLATAITDAFAPMLVGREFTSPGQLAELLRIATRRPLGACWGAAQYSGALVICLCGE